MAAKSIFYKITMVKKLTKAEYLDMIKSVRFFVAVGFSASFIVFLAVAWFGGLSNVAQIIENANMLFFSFAIGAIFLETCVRYGKWIYYMDILKVKLHWKKSFPIYLSIYSMDITPGKIGRVIGAYTLNRVSNIKFFNIVPMVAMDIFTDFLGVALLSIIVAILLQKYIIYTLILDAVLLLPFVFLLTPWLYKRLKVHFRGSKFFKAFSVYGEQYYTSQSKLNNLKVYFTSVLFTLPAEFFSSLSVYFSLKAIGISPSVLASTLIFEISQLFGMVSTLPGNIGVTDASLVALTSSILHVSASIGSTVAIMSRVASLWFPVLLGAFFLFWTLRYWDPKGKKKK